MIQTAQLSIITLSNLRDLDIFFFHSFLDSCTNWRPKESKQLMQFSQASSMGCISIVLITLTQLFQCFKLFNSRLPLIKPHLLDELLKAFPRGRANHPCGHGLKGCWNSPMHVLLLCAPPPKTIRIPQDPCPPVGFSLSHINFSSIDMSFPWPPFFTVMADFMEDSGAFVDFMGGKVFDFYS